MKVEQEFNEAAAFEKRMDAAIELAEDALQAQGKSLVDAETEALCKKLEEGPKTTKHNYGSYLGLIQGKNGYLVAVTLVANGGNARGIYWAGKINGLWN